MHGHDSGGMHHVGSGGHYGGVYSDPAHVVVLHASGNAGDMPPGGKPYVEARDSVRICVLSHAYSHIHQKVIELARGLHLGVLTNDIPNPNRSPERRPGLLTIDDCRPGLLAENTSVLKILNAGEPDTPWLGSGPAPKAASWYPGASGQTNTGRQFLAESQECRSYQLLMWLGSLVLILSCWSTWCLLLLAPLLYWQFGISQSEINPDCPAHTWLEVRWVTRNYTQTGDAHTELTIYVRALAVHNRFKNVWEDDGKKERYRRYAGLLGRQILSYLQSVPPPASADTIRRLKRGQAPSQSVPPPAVPAPAGGASLPIRNMSWQERLAEMGRIEEEERPH